MRSLWLTVGLLTSSLVGRYGFAAARPVGLWFGKPADPRLDFNQYLFLRSQPVCWRVGWCAAALLALLFVCYVWWLCVRVGAQLAGVIGVWGDAVIYRSPGCNHMRYTI